MQSLWPDNLSITKEEPRPVRILKEQAEFLAKQTQNVLVGDVSTYPAHLKFEIDYNTGDLDAPHGVTIICSFQVVSPKLKYHYELFFIAYGLKTYPLYLYGEKEILKNIDKQGYQIEIANEADFTNALRAIFAAPRTQELINNLFQQSISVN